MDDFILTFANIDNSIAKVLDKKITLVCSLLFCQVGSGALSSEVAQQYPFFCLVTLFAFKLLKIELLRVGVLGCRC